MTKPMVSREAFMNSITRFAMRNITLTQEEIDSCYSPDELIGLRFEKAYKRMVKFHKDFSFIRGTVGIGIPHWWFRHSDGTLFDFNALDMIPTTIVLDKGNLAQDLYAGHPTILTGETSNE